MNKPLLVVIGGATASGKTALAIEVAKHFKTDIISADSRQLYKELNIGVARPDKEQLDSVSHHFVASHSIHKPITAGEFATQAIDIINQLNKKIVIICGGTGLFIKSLTIGLDELPKANIALRKDLQEGLRLHGIVFLQNKLHQLSKEAFNKIDAKNPQRLMRQIEILSSNNMQQERKDRPYYPYVEFALNIDREILYNRINNRVDKMLDAGLVNEVRELLPFKELNSLKTVGYNELFEYFSGNLTIEQSIETIKQNTRRYAKRQITWFRNQHPEMNWVHAEEAANTIIRKIENKLNT